MTIGRLIGFNDKSICKLLEAYIRKIKFMYNVIQSALDITRSKGPRKNRVISKVYQDSRYIELLVFGLSPVRSLNLAYVCLNVFGWMCS
jgi:hypothetical protein